jgi:hypothetical protein
MRGVVHTASRTDGQLLRAGIWRQGNGARHRRDCRRKQMELSLLPCIEPGRHWYIGATGSAQAGGRDPSSIPDSRQDCSSTDRGASPELMISSQLQGRTVADRALIRWSGVDPGLNGVRHPSVHACCDAFPVRSSSGRWVSCQIEEDVSLPLNSNPAGCIGIARPVAASGSI